MRYDHVADLYDAENEHYAMLEEDVPFFLGQMPRRRQKVLELACGTGRVAIPIAQAGHRVVGVDFDPAMIRIAQRKVQFVGLGKPELDLRVGDVLKLNLRERFDWICILFNTFLSFPTLEQQDACLETVKRHLKPHGRFFMDVLHPNLGLLAQERSRDLDPHLFHSPVLGTNVLKTIDVDRDSSRQLEKVTFRYRWFDPNGKPRQRTTKFEMTFLFPRELQLLLERHGLAIEEMWGNYDGSPLNADSPRIIVRAARQHRK